MLESSASVRRTSALKIILVIGIIVLVIYVISCLWNRFTTVGSSTTSEILFSVKKETADGRTIRVRPLKDGEVKKLTVSDGTSFEEEKSKLGYPPTAVIYIDQDGNYWIGMPNSDHVESFHEKG